mgnify:FL=1
MKKVTSSKLSLALETILPLAMDGIAGGNGPAGVRTSCTPACGPQGPQGPKTLGGQSSPIATCLPSRVTCLP